NAASATTATSRQAHLNRCGPEWLLSIGSLMVALPRSRVGEMLCEPPCRCFPVAVPNLTTRQEGDARALTAARGSLTSASSGPLPPYLASCGACSGRRGSAAPPSGPACPEGWGSLLPRAKENRK